VVVRLVGSIAGAADRDATLAATLGPSLQRPSIVRVVRVAGSADRETTTAALTVRVVGPRDAHHCPAGVLVDTDRRSVPLAIGPSSWSAVAGVATTSSEVVSVATTSSMMGATGQP
jgi:hypothetical protein